MKQILTVHAPYKKNTNQDNSILRIQYNNVYNRVQILIRQQKYRKIKD